MSEHPMVIAAAKAIRKCDAFVGDPHEAVDIARAALSALRDLTPDVVEAGGIAADHAPLAEEAETFGEAYRPVARAAFTAMLNTIIGSDPR